MSFIWIIEYDLAQTKTSNYLYPGCIKPKPWPELAGTNVPIQYLIKYYKITRKFFSDIKSNFIVIFGTAGYFNFLVP